jgi:hypothetical protein
MKIKYPKRGIEEDLRDLLMDTNALSKQVKEVYDKYMAFKLGELSSKHLSCDSCDSCEDE